MRILLDTNILIPLESPQITIDSKLAKLMRLASKFKIDILVHDANFEDIKRYAKNKNREIILSRFEKYNRLDNIGEPSSNFLKEINSKHDSPRVICDDRLLYTLYKNSVHLLVTNDNGIHSKSKLLGIEAKVYRLEQVLSFIEKIFSEKDIRIPNIKDEFLYNIDINEPIFKTIIEEYPDFFDWFKNKAPEGRKAWIFKDSNLNTIGAICIYKEEKNLFGIKGKILKLCTFRVDDTSRGKKLGELLLKTAFKYCVENNYKAIYITLFPKKQLYLINLLEDFGFQSIGYNERRELIYLKKFFVKDINEVKNLDNLKFHLEYSPYFKNDLKINKFIIPIQPRFHKKLFPDNQKQNQLFYDNDPYGNAIKKAYICNSRVRDINKGDLIFFYRSHDYKAITNIGIVDDLIITNSPEELAAFVGKRTVYNLPEITNFCKKETIAILFRQIKNFDIFFIYNDLKKSNITKGIIYSIKKISDEDFKKIFKFVGGSVDDSFFTNKTELCT